MAFAPFETHSPKALRLFLLVPYLAAKASRPKVFRSAAHSSAALLRALIFAASFPSAFSLFSLAFWETHLP